MRLEHISLTNFRNFVRLELDLPAHIVLLQGDNAQGKTNFLEAIYYLATARSPFATADRQLINWLAGEEGTPFARLVAQVERGGDLQRIEIVLLEEPTAEEPHRCRKLIRINGVPKRVLDLVGQMKVVLFMPQHLDLVAGPPSARRHYLDATLCQLDARYRRSLARYGRILTQRNHLLRSLQERRGDLDELLFWDRKLAEEGAYIMARRQSLVAELDELAQAIHLDLTGGRERLRLRYLPSIEVPDVGYQMSLELAPTSQPPASGVQRIAEAFLERLRQARGEEIQRGMSLFGPHRDEMRFLVGGVDLGLYGSRGQQRTAVLALKLAELELVRREAGEEPILLLDEVMSELDEAHRRYLMEVISGAQQTILTATDLSDYSPDFLAQATLLRVREGRIEKMTNRE